MKVFSKWAIRAMIYLWIIGAGYGAAVVTAELVAVFCGLDAYSASVTVHLPELLTYIGAPMASGIVAYCAKSAFENREKIKQNYIPDYEEQEPERRF